MTRTILSLAALMMSAGVLLAGNGLQGTLIAVRANIEAYSLAAIGVIAASYYAGFIAGCMLAPRMIARAGHIRAFAAFAAIAAATSLIYAISVEFFVWAFLRAVTGFCFAGLYMIIESWINEKAENESRGRVLSVYRIIDFAALTIGQFLLMAADPAGFVLFSLVAIFIALAIVPVSMTKVEGPKPPAQSELNLLKMWRLSPLAVAGSFAVGLSNGAFWGVAPVFVLQLGHGASTVSLFMSAAIIASALTQWPVGLLSDKTDRRIVLVAVTGGAALAGLFLFFFAAMSTPALMIGAAGFGAFAICIFGLCAAHANDHASDEDFVATSGGLLLVFGVGSVIGPVVAPLIMSATAPQALFAYTAGVHTLLFLFGIYRMMRRAAVPVDEQADFVPAPVTTPTVFEIDPRGAD